MNPMAFSGHWINGEQKNPAVGERLAPGGEVGHVPDDENSARNK
jgi:hypothetical protein